MKKRYIPLRVIAIIMEILGVVVGILTIFSACGLLGAGVKFGSELDKWTGITGQNQGALGTITGLAGGLLMSLLPIILGGGIALLLFVGGAVIIVQIDIEENTRKTNWYVTQYNWQRPSTSYEGQQSRESITNTSPHSLPNAVTNFCPMCGSDVTDSQQNCPQCNHKLR